MIRYCPNCGGTLELEEPGDNAECEACSITWRGNAAATLRPTPYTPGELEAEHAARHTAQPRAKGTAAVPPSFETLFITNYAAAAARAAADTGLLTSVVLAQWANETFFGTSRAFVFGNNFAGVSPGGTIGIYGSQSAGIVAYVQSMNQSLYDPVRAARKAGARAQAVALGRSPWAGGHYENAANAGPGSALVDLIDGLNLTAYDGAEDQLNPPPPTIGDPEMFTTDQATGGIWGTDENGDGYGFLGAPYPGGLNEHPEWKAGAAESGGAAICVGIGYWKDGTGDGSVFFTKPGGTTPNGSPYSPYRFRRQANGVFAPA